VGRNVARGSGMARHHVARIKDRTSAGGRFVVQSAWRIGESGISKKDGRASAAKDAIDLWLTFAAARSAFCLRRRAAHAQRTAFACSATYARRCHTLRPFYLPGAIAATCRTAATAYLLRALAAGAACFA